jgi:hypothetical protein
MLGRDNTKAKKTPLDGQQFRAMADRVRALTPRDRADETTESVNQTSCNSIGPSQQSCQGRWMGIIDPDDHTRVEGAWLTYLVESGRRR